MKVTHVTTTSLLTTNYVHSIHSTSKDITFPIYMIYIDASHG